MRDSALPMATTRLPDILRVGGCLNTAAAKRLDEAGEMDTHTPQELTKWRCARCYQPHICCPVSGVTTVA